MINHTDYDDRTEQTITFNLDDLVNAALQAALKDGDGLDFDSNSEAVLTVFSRGNAEEFDDGMDFVIGWYGGAIVAISEHDTVAQVILTITNPDRRLR